MATKQLDIQPANEVEETLFLLYRNEIPVVIPDTAVIRNGVLKGLFHCDAHHDSPIQYNGDWPVVDYDSHQTRMYSTKRASEQAAKMEVAATFFAKDSAAFDAPVVIHITTARSSSPTATKSKKRSIDVCCQFYTKSRFVELLRMGNIPDGLICRYTAPHNKHHNLVRVLFTPFALHIEQHQAHAAVDDSSVSMAERVSVSPGNGGAYDVMIPSEETKAYARQFCGRMFDFFRTQEVVLDRAVYFFMEQEPGRLSYMWASNVELKPWFLGDCFEFVDEAAEQQIQAEGGSATHPLLHSDEGKLLATTSVLTAASKMDATRQFNNDTLYQNEHVGASPSKQQTRFPHRLCPSPVLPAFQGEAMHKMLADVRDFGFYSDEPERIKDSLKRQIRSIARVQLPASLELDDTPPYTDEFIAALCDPVKAEAYFFPNSQGGFGKNRKKSVLSRFRSKVFKFINASDEDALAERSSKLENSFGSFRRVRSGSLAISTANSAGTPKSPSRSELSFALADKELSQILAQHANDVNISILQKTIPRANQEAAAIIDKAIPDWKHSGHIAELRRKYGCKKFSGDENEAEYRRLARVQLTNKQAERRLSVSSATAQQSVTSTEQISSHASRNNDMVSRLLKNREKKWTDVLHVDHDAKAPFRRLAKAPVSSTQHLLQQIIPKYESKLAQGSMMGYLVGTESFEREPKVEQLDVPLEDCIATSKDRRYTGIAAPQVPDVPVVELTNLHLSLSQEMIIQRKSDRHAHNSMLEMIFGQYDSSAKSLQSIMSRSAPRRANSAGHASLRRLSSWNEPLSSRSDEMGDSFMRSQQAFADQLARSMQNDEKKQRRMKFQRHGIADSKEKVSVIVGTFEDLVYQWASDPANDLKKNGAPRTAPPAPQKMVLHVPPSYYHLRRELRSLFIAIGFEEESVESITIPSYQQAITDDILEEVPQYVKIFSIDVTPVTVSRVTAAARLFAADVAQLYADEKWEIIEKIREMTETQGFTFVDAVLMIASGNLMERSNVSAPAKTFADIRL